MVPLWTAASSIPAASIASALTLTLCRSSDEAASGSRSLVGSCFGSARSCCARRRTSLRLR
jgi:hypothetical protein